MPVVSVAEVCRLALGLVSRHAVELLQLAGELLALALDLREVVVSELSPLLLHLALDLVPCTSRSVVVRSRLRKSRTPQRAANRGPGRGH